jgi:hypothetical protein
MYQQQQQQHHHQQQQQQAPQPYLTAPPLNPSMFMGGMGMAPQPFPMQPQQQQSQQQQQLPPNATNPLLNKLQLPPNILKLFSARPPTPFFPPIDKRKMPPYDGVAQFIPYMEDEQPELPECKMPDSRFKRKERIEREKKEKHEKEIREALKNWDPNKDPHATSNPYTTIFVAKLVGVIC